MRLKVDTLTAETLYTAPPPPTLHQYQEDAVEWLRRRRSAGLLLDMGLGKTAIVLTALESDKLPALVVAPKRVAEQVWSREAEIWRKDLRVRVAAGTPDQRRAALEDRSQDVIVIGRDNLKDAVPYAKHFTTFVIDELSGFKNRQSARWKAARKIARGSGMDHVWGLTGTPSPNGLMDLWAQLFLLDGGHRLGTALTKYREGYFVAGRQLANGVVTEWNLRPGAESKIQDLISDICLSMGTEGRVDLPPVSSNVVRVPLPPAARKIYKEMKRDLVTDMDLLGEVHSAVNAAVMSAKLSQITAGFIYSDDADINGGQYSAIHKEKANALREILEGTGSPVLVFYRFRAELEILRDAFPGESATMEEPNIIDRWNAGEVPVLFAHPASAGHGLNLQFGGHTIVWTSPTWSLEEHQQANKRLARQGQKHPVVVHYLESPHTIDAAITARLGDKKTVQDALMDHLDSPL